MNFALCVLLQDDQSTPWSSMENQNKRPHGRHTYLLDTGQHLGSEKNPQ